MITVIKDAKNNIESCAKTRMLDEDVWLEMWKTATNAYSNQFLTKGTIERIADAGLVSFNERFRNDDSQIF